MAGLTGIEPATSGVTDRHSNQLSYSPPNEALKYRIPVGLLQGRYRQLFRISCSARCL